MLKRFAGLAAGLVVLAAAPVAHAANVNVRVEGTADTLLPRTAVTTSAGTFTKDGDPAHACSYSSAGGALERGTGGDWSGTWASFGDYQVKTIEGETHTAASGATSGEYWALWLNYKYATTGACTSTLQEGDDVLFLPSCFGCAREPSPLRISSAPASASAGAPFDVKVVQYDLTYDENFNAITTEAPAAGAVVSAGGQGFTADADGVAHVTVGSKGTAGVRASKGGYVRSATESVCVDCGAPAGGGVGPAARDTVAPGVALALRDGAVFSRRRAPRLLRGTVTADPSGLQAVKLRLTRRVGRRCSYFSGRRERFRRMRCGHGSWFRIGDRAEWSYLLPKRLGRGRYVLEAKAIDGAFNRGAPARARFRVR